MAYPEDVKEAQKAIAYYGKRSKAYRQTVNAHIWLIAKKVKELDNNGFSIAANTALKKLGISRTELPVVTVN